MPFMARWPITTSALKKIYHGPLFVGGFSLAVMLAVLFLVNDTIGLFRLIIGVAHAVASWSMHWWFGWVVLLVALLMMLLGIRQTALAEENETLKRQQVIDEVVDALNSKTSKNIEIAVAIAALHMKSERVRRMRERLSQAEDIVAKKRGAIEHLSHLHLAGENEVEAAAETNSLRESVNDLREFRGLERSWNPPNSGRNARLDNDLQFVVDQNGPVLREWTENLNAAAREVEEFRRFVVTKEAQLNEIFSFG
jgi:hypothetical protein